MEVDHLVHHGGQGGAGKELTQMRRKRVAERTEGDFIGMRWSGDFNHEWTRMGKDLVAAGHLPAA